MISQYTHKYNKKTLKIWHRDIEYLRMNDLKRLFDMTNNINLINVVRYNDVCFLCMKEKQIKKFSRQSQTLVIELLECIDSDVDDFISSQSLERKKYFVLFINRVFEAGWDYLIIRKSEVFDIFINKV